MDEREFEAAAEAALELIERQLDATGLDFEVKDGGVIEIALDDGSKVIVNRHRAAQEIWLAARSGGYHFRLDGGRWIGTRSGEELTAALSRCLSEQAGRTVGLG